MVLVNFKLSVILIVKNQNQVIKQIKYSSNLFSIKSSVRPVKKQLCVSDHAAHPISCGGQSLPKRCECKIKGSPAFSKMQFFLFCCWCLHIQICSKKEALRRLWVQRSRLERLHRTPNCSLMITMTTPSLESGVWTQNNTDLRLAGICWLGSRLS